MRFLTVIFGLALTALGVWNFTASGETGLGAFMPAIFGLLAMAFGFLQGQREDKNFLLGAVMMAILTLISSLRGLWSLVIFLTGGQPALSTELIAVRSIRGVLSIIFIALAVWLIKDFWTHWKAFGQLLGDWLARVVLSVFYFTILVPFGIGVRLFSDPLAIKSLPDELWRPRDTGDKSIEDVLRQY